MLEVAKGLPKGPARVGTVRRGAGRGFPESAELAAGAAGPTRPPAPPGCRSHAFVTPLVSANEMSLPSSGFPFDPSYSQEALKTNTGPIAAPGATANSRQTSQPQDCPTIFTEQQGSDAVLGTQTYVRNGRAPSPSVCRQRDRQMSRQLRRG